MEDAKHTPSNDRPHGFDEQGLHGLEDPHSRWPRKSGHREGVTFTVLPLRMEASVVDKLDEAWRSRGIRNRMEFFRGALGHYLKHLGAEDAAALFANDAAMAA